MRRTFTVRWSRPLLGWRAEFVELSGGAVWGRSIAVARRRLREVQAEFHAAGQGSVEFVEEFSLGPSATEAVRAALAARERARVADQAAREAARAAREALRLAVGALTRDERFSLRDAAEFLGVAHQRLHEVLGRDGKGSYW